jgi:hypothetical protein
MSDAWRCAFDVSGIMMGIVIRRRLSCCLIAPKDQTRRPLTRDHWEYACDFKQIGQLVQYEMGECIYIYQIFFRIMRFTFRGLHGCLRCGLKKLFLTFYRGGLLEFNLNNAPACRCPDHQRPEIKTTLQKHQHASNHTVDNNSGTKKYTLTE